MYIGKQCLMQSAVSKSLAMMVAVRKWAKTYGKRFKESTKSVSEMQIGRFNKTLHQFERPKRQKSDFPDTISSEE
ncbi:hypothetical protein TNCV_2213481 [Trichonephila clavipes]|nr:hypothetical protein TNCV_2213481 [Trichonephila clavipes]